MIPDIPFVIGGALFGILAAVAGVFGSVVGVALLLSKNKSRVLMAALVLTFMVPLHKIIGPVVTNTQSGAPGLILDGTTMVMLALVTMWIVEGTFQRDVIRALRRPIFWAPAAGMLLYSFSIFNSENSYLSISELYRLTLVYAVFFYFGARVKKRSEIAAVLSILCVFVFVEFFVVSMQKFTGGVFGLDVLGVPQTQQERTSALGSVGRPAGTLIHPVFLAIVLCMIVLIALSLAIFMKDRKIRIISIGVIPFALVQIYFSQSRGPLLGLAPAMVMLIIVGTAYHRINAKIWVGATIAVLLGAAAVSPQLTKFYKANFGDKHIDLEVRSRLQLNTVGFRMFYDEPLAGHGLNNFTQVMDEFTGEPLLFPGYPSHNFFVLTAAETGLLGLAAVALIGVSLAWRAMRLAASRDPFFRSIGFAMLSILLLHIVAEQLSYSLRQEVPLYLLWLFAGLMMACFRIQEDEKRQALMAYAPPPLDFDPTIPEDGIADDAHLLEESQGIRR